MNCFDTQNDSSQTVETLNTISKVSNSHGYDNFDVQNYYEDMPIFDEYENDLEEHKFISAPTKFP